MALVNITVRFYELHWYKVVNRDWRTTSLPEPILQLVHLMRDLTFMDIKTNVNRRMVSKRRNLDDGTHKNGSGWAQTGSDRKQAENTVVLDRATNRTCKSDEGDIQ